MIDFTHQKFLITGGTSGIGKAIAQTINDLNGCVFLVGRNSERLNKAKSEFKNPSKCEILVMDLENPNSIKTQLKESVDSSGRFNGMVNAAGIDITKPLKLLSPKDFDLLFKLNITSPFSIVKDLTHKSIFSENGGSIVFISSVMASLGQKGKIAYSASKSAITGMVKSMALELATKNIRVNSVAPGIVETPLTHQLFSMISEDAKEEIKKMHPMGFGKPEDVANLVCFLLSNQASWITGSEYLIDGGYHIH